MSMHARRFSDGCEGDRACCAPLLTDAARRAAAEELAGAFKALADPVRLRLLSLIAAAPDGTACSCDLEAPVGKSQPTVSHHLAVLADAGLITKEKVGPMGEVHRRARAPGGPPRRPGGADAVAAAGSLLTMTFRPEALTAATGSRRGRGHRLPAGSHGRGVGVPARAAWPGTRCVTLIRSFGGRRSLPASRPRWSARSARRTTSCWSPTRSGPGSRRRGVASRPRVSSPSSRRGGRSWPPTWWRCAPPARGTTLPETFFLETG